MRVALALLGVTMVAFNTALMMSDRAPRLIRVVAGDVVNRLSERIDAGARPEFRADARRLASDATVHVGVWFVAVVLVGLAVWSWRALAPTAVGVFLLSIAVELGQERFSAKRTVEWNDIVANAIGVALGTIVIAAAYGWWNSASSARRERRAMLTG